MKNNINSGFSLIELSIVLIIMGFLIAGVTGGQSLIEAAKLRAEIDTIRDIKQSVYAFYNKNGRLPGDLDEDGMIDTDDYDGFSGVFDGVEISEYVVPFADMYLDGISIKGFDTSKADSDTCGSTTLSKCLPRAKIDSSAVYILQYIRSNNAYANHDAGDYLILSDYYEIKLNTKDMQSIDIKIDDGVMDTGQFITVFGTDYEDYQEAIDNGELARAGLIPIDI